MSSIHPRFAVCALAVLTLAGCIVVGGDSGSARRARQEPQPQAQAQPQPAAGIYAAPQGIAGVAPGAVVQPADPALAQCRHGSREAWGEAMQQVQRARAATPIASPNAPQLSVIELRLNRLMRSLYGSAGMKLTLPECQAITEQIATERAAVVKLTAPVPQTPPAVAQCRDESLKAHAGILQQYQAARGSGQISAEETQQFAAVEQRLNEAVQALWRTGLTLAECQALGQKIAREGAAVTKMAAPDPQLLQCQESNQKARAAAVQDLGSARAARKPSPQETEQFAAIEIQLAQAGQMLAGNALTLPDCQTVGQVIASHRAALAKITASAPTPAPAAASAPAPAPAPAASASAPVVVAAPAVPATAPRVATPPAAAAAPATAPAAAPAPATAPAVPAAPVPAPAPAAPRPDPQLVQCRETVLSYAADAKQVMTRARASGQLGAAALSQLAASEQKLSQWIGALGGADAGMPACQRIGQQIGMERDAVVKTASGLKLSPNPDRQVVNCQNAADVTYGHLLMDYNRARLAGRISPQDAPRYAAMEQRLSQAAEKLWRKDLKLPECQAATRQIREEGIALTRYAG